jgi:lysophospholipase L1-like esterase
MLIQPGAKFLFIGDSVTDCGRAQPVGEGLFGALGTGYVSLVDALIQTGYPDRDIRIVNVGNSGNTVLELAGRWERDVHGLKPDWLSVFIGVNDVWRQFDSPLQKETHVLPQTYANTYERLLSTTRPGLKGLVLMTPFVIEPNRDDPMRRRMDEYGEIVRGLAAKYDAVLVDVQAAFDAATAHRHPMFFAWDRIHPNMPGAMVIARAVLNALKFEWKG